MKKCFKCLKYKSLSDFYSHPATSDKLLGKCKDCTKSDNNKHRRELSKNIEWRIKERKRIRKSNSKRVRLKPSSEIRNEYSRNSTARHPDHKRANNMVFVAIKKGEIIRLPCEICGEKIVEAHHDSYDKPLEVRWLCRKHHVEFHVKKREVELRNILLNNAF